MDQRRTVTVQEQDSNTHLVAASAAAISGFSVVVDIVSVSERFQAGLQNHSEWQPWYSMVINDFTGQLARIQYSEENKALHCSGALHNHRTWSSATDDDAEVIFLHACILHAFCCHSEACKREG